MSLDGYVATEDDGLDFLSVVDREGEDYGYHDFVKDIDTYIVGRRTYDVAKQLLDGDFPQARKFDCYVITRQEREPSEGVTFYSGNMEDLIKDLRDRPGKNIYCDGGPQIVRLLAEKDLIDEWIISVIPVLIGRGISLFLESDSSRELELLGSKAYPSGLVQLHYRTLRT